MIYAIEAVGSGFVKFGKADWTVRRLSSLQTASPYELVVIAKADWPDAEERKIHRYLADARYRGEWFRIGPRTIEVVEMMHCSLDDWHKFLVRNAPSRLRRAMSYIV